MSIDEPRPRIGHRGNAVSRAKDLAMKALVVIGGVLMLASAFVLSLVFLAIGLVIVLIGGGYLWWKTRELRKQVRERMQNARMQEQFPPKPGSQVIEGEVVSSSERTRR